MVARQGRLKEAKIQGRLAAGGMDIGSLSNLQRSVQSAIVVPLPEPGPRNTTPGASVERALRGALRKAVDASSTGPDRTCISFE